MKLKLAASATAACKAGFSTSGIKSVKNTKQNNPLRASDMANALFIVLVRLSLILVTH